MAGDYNLKIVFALKEGNYLADASVLIKDAQDRTVLEAVSDGPWFYAKLPAGQYAVTATMMEKANTEKVQIKPAGQSVLHFYWTE
jgi:dipeptidase